MTNIPRPRRQAPGYFTNPLGEAVFFLASGAYLPYICHITADLAGKGSIPIHGPLPG